MKRWWISWVEVSEDYRPSSYPPNAAILGWWCSGATEDGATICAAVEARHEADARDAILKDWPEALELGDWRFFEERPADWNPQGRDSRFPLSDWMEERFGIAST